MPLRAVTGVRGASERSVPEVAWSPLRPPGPARRLRRLADAGARCVVHLVDGGQHEAYVDRVGADFLESARHRDGEVLLVPYDGSSPCRAAS